MNHAQVPEGRRLRPGPLKTVVSHHREPDRETFQIVDVEFLEESANNTLSVLAYRSGG